MTSRSPEVRYQVLISSTFVDLKEERMAVTSALLTAEAIPTGMENFGAAASSSWDVMKAFVEAADVVVLIIGSRYGSIDPDDGKSYTQKEFEYAEQLGKPVLVFVPASDYRPPLGLSTEDDDTRLKLEQFIEQASGYQRVEWVNSADLVAKVGQGFQLWRQYAAGPTAGWIRRDSVSLAARPLRPVDVVNSSSSWSARSEREIDVVLREWRTREAQRTVSVTCEFTAGTNQLDMEGQPVRQRPLPAVTTLPLSRIFESVSRELGRSRVQSESRVVRGLENDLWINRHELFSSALEASMEVAKLDLQQRAAFSVGTPQTHGDVPVHWDASLDDESAMRVAIMLKRARLLVADGTLWYLSESGLELLENDLVPLEDEDR